MKVWDEIYFRCIPVFIAEIFSRKKTGKYPYRILRMIFDCQTTLVGWIKVEQNILDLLKIIDTS